MIRNYLKTAFRNIIREKGYSIINISGLAVGIVCCLLILLFVRDELSYDKFHTKGDRIYRITLNYQNPGQAEMSSGMGPFRLAQSLETDFPEMEKIVRISEAVELPITYKEKEFIENIQMVEACFFEVFSFTLLKGNPVNVLQEPFTIVISESIASKYFGEEDPVGKTLKTTAIPGDVQFEITGVMESIPPQSHIHPDIVLSLETARGIFNERQLYNWGEFTVYTYILLPENQSASDITAKFPDFVEKIYGEGSSEDFYISLFPLFDIHLKSHTRFEIETNGDISNIYVFSCISLFILVIASINYMNLATARSTRRAREVSMRKVTGASKRQLIYQFIGEAVLLTFLATWLAILIAEFIMPFFNSIAGKNLEISFLNDWRILLGVFFASLAVGIISGIYPALILSGFKPVKVLSGEYKLKFSNIILRKGLVVLQFSISIIMIISTLFTYGQWRYMNNKKLGVNTENIIILPLPSGNYKAYKNEILKNPEVLNVTASNKRPTRGLTSNLGYTAEGLDPEIDNSIKIVTVDFDFFKTLDNKIINGRNFSRDITSDATEAFILNESAVKDIGWDNPIGKWFETSTLDSVTDNWKTRRGTVIGVAEDFHFESLHNEIKPVVYFIDSYWLNWMSIKIGTSDIPGTVKFLEQKWEEIVMDNQFDYTFYDQDLKTLYKAEADFLKLFIIFSIIAIIIACLGVLGLVSFTAEQKTKEIGIRKILGASVGRIIFLISNEFIVLVLIACLIAGPVAWYFMKAWLSNFPYRIPLSVWIFFLAALIALLIAVLTTSIQAIKAATKNPVNAIKYE